MSMMEPELRKTKILKNDIPINSVDEDLFNRKDFAEIIANSIQSYSQSSSRSFVFGISGEWGSGKTSTINMVKGILSKPKDDERFRIIEFTPWFFHGGSGLVSEFLTQFAIALSGADRQFKTTAVKALELAQVLRPLKYLPGIGKVVDATLDASSSLSRFLKENRQTVNEMKDEINRKIKSTGIKLLVIIDDLDRLSDKETAEMLMAIRCIADFENTFYLLAYDHSLLVQACDKIQKNFGEQYIGKIIQLPATLPSLTKRELKNYFLRELINVDELQNLSFSQNERFQSLISDGLSESFRNPRDVIRFMNLFPIKLRNARGELDPIDLFCLTMIEVFGHDLFIHIKEKGFILTGQSMLYKVGDKERREHKEEIVKDLEGIFLRLNYFGPISRRILLRLFPAIREYFPDVYARIEEDESEASLKSNWRIAHPDRFESYFCFSIPPEVIGKIEMERIIQASANEQDLKERFEHYKSKGLLFELFPSIDDIASSREMSLTKDQVRNLSDILVIESDNIIIPEGIVETKKRMATKIVKKLILTISSMDERKEIVNFLFQRADQSVSKVSLTYISILVFLVASISADIEERFEASVIEEFLKKMLALLERKADIDVFVKLENAMNILFYWREWSKDNQQFQSFLRKLTESNLHLLQFIASSASKSISTEKPHVRYEVYGRYFEEMEMMETIRSKAATLLRLLDEQGEEFPHRQVVKTFLEECLHPKRRKGKEVNGT